MKPFQSLKNPLTKDQIAVNIAKDTIESYRLERMTQGSESPETEYGMRLLKTLAVLMKGPHGAKVRPVVYEAFPELEPPKGTA